MHTSIRTMFCAVVLACVSPTVPAGDLFAPVEAGPFLLGAKAQKKDPLRIEAGAQFPAPLGTVSHTFSASPLSGNAKSVTRVKMVSPPAVPVSVAVHGEHEVRFGDHAPTHRTSATGAAGFSRGRWKAGATFSQQWNNGLLATRAAEVRISQGFSNGIMFSLAGEWQTVNDKAVAGNVSLRAFSSHSTNALEISRARIVCGTSYHFQKNIRSSIPPLFLQKMYAQHSKIPFSGHS
jgi:hypothetical protein